MSTPTSPTPPPSPPPSPQQGQPAAPVPQYQQPYEQQAGPGPQPPYGYPPMSSVPSSAAYYQPTGALGRMRPTGMTILLIIVTLGIWGFVYYYQVFEEMRRHTGRGLGGVFALVISIIFSILTPFLLSNEVGQLYEYAGRQKPVSALTALWYFPGMLILVGPFIWFVQTNRALNEYWQSLGVTQETLV